MITCRQRRVRVFSYWLPTIIVAAVVRVAALQTAPTLDEGKRLFFNARYREAADIARECEASNSDDGLARDELRASALLFQLRGLLEPPDRTAAIRAGAFEGCAPCRDLVAAFMTATANGQQAARRRLQADPSDETALFFLGKLDL